jgi:NAD(P)H-dependent FMN reductase
MKNIFAVSGSLREGSSNHNILRILGKMTPAGINYSIYDGLRDIPAFDPGTDDDNPPAPVAHLREKLSQADGIIICTPEYAFGVPGALKNALDWMVSSGSFSGKPTSLVTASTGGEIAHEAMIKVLGAIDAKLSCETNLLVQFVRSKMDADGNITDPETAQKLKNLIEAFIEAV